MGSLTSRPKIAAQSQSSYVPYPAAGTTATTPTTPIPTPTITKADPETVAQTRAENVLRRNRGVVGTVLTGFRGLLESAISTGGPARKTLLGE